MVAVLVEILGPAAPLRLPVAEAGLIAGLVVLADWPVSQTGFVRAQAARHDAPPAQVAMRTSRWAAVGLSVGDLIMARRQMLNLKQLAERHQHHGTARDWCAGS